MPENPAPETSAPSAGDGMGSTPKSSNLKIKNAMAKKIKGRPRNADPCGTTSIRTPAVEIRHAAGYLAYILCNWVKYDAKLVRSHTVGSDEAAYIVLRIARAGEIELIRPLRELRDARRVLLGAE